MIPCSHVIVICNHIHLAYFSFVEKTYKLSQYQRFWLEVQFDIFHSDKNLLREHDGQNLRAFIIRRIGENLVQKCVVDYVNMKDITSALVQLVI